MPEADVVKTGINGLDGILFGGFPRGNTILVSGAAGTGKTTLGVEFVYRGARQFHEPGMIVLFEVAPDKLVRDAALFGWDLRELERDGRLKIVFTTRQVFQQELLQADSVLLAEAAEFGARRLFVDGLVPLPEPNGGDSRDAFHLLAEGLHRENLTAMLALESTFADAEAMRAPEEFVADTLLRLSIEPVQRAVLRSIAAVKSRGREYALGRHSFRIVNGQGLDVYRRVQAPPQPATRTGRRLRPHLAGCDGHSRPRRTAERRVLRGEHDARGRDLGCGEERHGPAIVAEGARRGER